MCSFPKCETEKFLFSDNSIDTSDLSSLEKIAEGSFSNVYSFKKDYAVKIMKNKYCKYLDNIAEIVILNNLQSKYIVKCYGVILINNNLSIIMDYISQNLSNYVIKDEISKNSIIEQLCDGLKFLHENFILHLDFVPNNILIKDEISGPKIFISDFSHSCKSETLSIDSISHRISPFYRPYENLKGSFIYSNKSDIWSLGIIIYEIINNIKIENIITLIRNNSEYYYELSVILYIEKLISWNKWPLKIGNYSNFLSIDLSNRHIDGFSIVNQTNPITKFTFKLEETNEIFHQNTERLYNLIIKKYTSKELEIFIENNYELYKLCFYIIYSISNYPDKIVLSVDVNKVRFILKIITENLILFN